MSISATRIWGMCLRHLYLFRRSLDRLTDAFYWPTIDLIVWGLTFSALSQSGLLDDHYVFSVIAAVILWFVVWRGQGEVTINLLEELWSENWGNVMSSPLSIGEWLISMVLLSIFKLALTVALTSLLAFVLYAVNIFNLGLFLIPFIASLLIFSFSFGFFMCGMFFRFGTNIQTLAWAGGFVIMPFSATYYSLSSLPDWVQFVAKLLPSSYVFEGLRTVAAGNTVPMGVLVGSLGLSVGYFLLSLLFFWVSFQASKNKGLGHLR